MKSISIDLWPINALLILFKQTAKICILIKNTNSSKYSTHCWSTLRDKENIKSFIYTAAAYKQLESRHWAAEHIILIILFSTTSGQVYGIRKMYRIYNITTTANKQLNSRHQAAKHTCCNWSTEETAEVSAVVFPVTVLYLSSQSFNLCCTRARCLARLASSLNINIHIRYLAI